MTVRRQKVNGKLVWVVDIKWRHPDGEVERVRQVSPIQTRKGGEARERALREGLQNGTVGKRARPTSEVPVRAVPTLAQFWNRFLREHCEAQGQKPSGIRRKREAYSTWLEPRLGHLQLDRITSADVAQLRSAMAEAGRGSSSMNNAVSTLSMMLKKAKEWGVLSEIGCETKLIKVPTAAPKFYDFGEYERLVGAAAACGPRELALVLLGGDAGLRRGEIRALTRRACGHGRGGKLLVEQAVSDDVIVATKGLAFRSVPMTARLANALKALPNGCSDMALASPTGDTLSKETVRSWMRRAQAGAGLRSAGDIHILRHTFCTHLAMKGVPVNTIQRLAGHKHLTTTLRYMHVVDGAAEDAIRILESERAI